MRQQRQEHVVDVENVEASDMSSLQHTSSTHEHHQLQVCTRISNGLQGPPSPPPPRRALPPPTLPERAGRRKRGPAVFCRWA